VVISKGKDWGSRFLNNQSVLSFSSEADLAQAAKQYLDRGEKLCARISQCDLTKVFGVEKSIGDSMIYSVDLGVATLDGGSEVAFVSHCFAGKPFMNCDFYFAMNSSFYRNYTLGPKSHINDGLLDFTTGKLSLSQLYLARKKAELGVHVPHPDLKYFRKSSTEFNFKQKTVYCDHVNVGKCKKLTVRIIEDAFFLII